MVLARFTSLLAFFQAYPEIILVPISLFIVRSFSLNKSRVVKKWPLLRIISNISRLHDWCTDLLQRRGGTVVVKGPPFSQLHMLLTCDPENTSYISSRTNFTNYPKGHDYAQLFDILGDGILNADSDSWQIQRKWAHKLLRQKGFRQLVAKTSRDKVEKGLVPLLDHMAQRDLAVDLQDVFQRYTFDVSCILMCGVDPGCLYPTFPVVPFVKAMEDANEVILRRHVIPNSMWKLQRWLKVGNERKMARAWKTINHVLANLITTRRRELKEAQFRDDDAKAKEQVDLLTAYMSHPTDDPEMEKLKSDDNFLRDTILNMLAAGRNTTSAALTWLFWELSRNPEVEEKIMKELKTANLANKKEEAGPPQKFKVYEADEVSGLPYLHAALCECLRLYPSVPLVLKGVEKPDTLPSGQRVVPGMRIIVTLYAMGRMESVWGDNYLEFKPERWLTEEGSFNYDMLHSKFLVFSTGPRSCLGRDLSFTQMKVVVASLLHNFHIRVVEGQKATPAVSVTLQMKNGLMAKMARRCA
ncbi:alkane hydroxylase MAH1-like [Aristolochia californica]|uniref:alkane hydroxylase MAH1-like n=1 Tax=Aristolochia californica TaxID=171875 RepID=UPI0035D7670F